MPAELLQPRILAQEAYLLRLLKLQAATTFPKAPAAWSRAVVPFSESFLILFLLDIEYQI